MAGERPMNEWSTEELVALLKSDVDEWNERREKIQGVEVNLRRVNLNRAHLIGANLAGANLIGANLSGASLSRAYLAGANLTGTYLNFANLVDAHLEKTNLAEADLYRAHLMGADLTGANLSNANLRGAYLSHTDISHAQLSRATFANTKLKTTRNLDLCEFWLPASVDLHTLAKSWPLPQNFLRGCGLPDQYIDYLPALLSLPLEIPLRLHQLQPPGRSFRPASPC